MIENRDFGWYIFEGGEEEAFERYMWTNLNTMTLGSRIRMCYFILTKTSPKWVWSK